MNDVPRPHPSWPGLLRACPRCHRWFALRRSRTWLAPSGAWVRAFECRFCRERLTFPASRPAETG